MANDIDRPRRNQVAHYEAPTPRSVPGDPIDRVLTRFDARGRTKTLNALTDQAEAGTRYLNSLTAGGRSLIAYLDVRAEIADLPAKYAHQAAVTLENRKASHEEAVHRGKYAYMQYEQRELQAEAEIRRAHITLTELDQALDAQREYGMGVHRLRHLQNYAAQLGEEIDIDTKKKLLAGFFDQQEKPKREATGDTLARLYATREQLEAAGLPTEQIDAAIDSLE